MSDEAAKVGGEKKTTAVAPGGTSPWMNGAELIDTLLHPDSRVAQLLTPKEAKGLENVRKLLVSAHVQDNVVPAELTSGDDNPVNLYLAEQFGGVRRKPTLKAAAKSVLNGLTFIKMAKTQAAMKNQRASVIERSQKSYLPPEWHRLSTARQNYVYQRLKYGSLTNWGFDVFDFSIACGEVPLIFVGWAVLCAPYAQKAMALDLGLEESDEDGFYELVDEFCIQPEVMCNFLRLVEADCMKEAAYHNNIHAADVVQTLYALLQMGGDKYSSSELEIFALLVAAVCHDMGHRGRNNSFEINSKSDLAIIYNDHSVLENMSAARGYRILTHNPGDKDTNANILLGMQASQKEAFRSIFTHAILGTDLSQHFTMLGKIKGQMSRGGDAGPSKFYHTIDGRSISRLLLFLLHAADISNPTKPAPIFTEWSERALGEFFAQGDAEKKAFLPVSPMCDREMTVKSDSQLGFIKFIVRPTFVLLSDLIPKVVDVVLPVVEENLKYWEEQKVIDEGGMVQDP
ncbi:hypothetical protein ACHAWF_003375 [Thalassiosira exigua]